MFKPINGYTKASILETIRNQFTTKSIGPSGYCVYRGLGGAKCAVGIFIPDSVYRPEMDNMDWTRQGTDIETNLEYFPELAPYMPLELGALQMLQGTHDLGGDADQRSNGEILADLLNWVKINVAE